MSSIVIVDYDPAKYTILKKDLAERFASHPNVHIAYPTAKTDFVKSVLEMVADGQMR